MQDERLITLFQSLQKATSFEQCWAAYRFAMSDIGLTKGNYVAGLAELEDFNDLIYLTDYDTGFLEAYDELNGKSNDVTLHYCISSQKTLDWSKNPLLNNLTKEQKRVENLIVDYGMLEGFSTPFMRPSGELYGGIAVCIDSIKPKEFDRDIRREQAFYEQATRLFQAYSDGLFSSESMIGEQAFYMPKLNQDELDIIKWLAEGKTTSYIAYDLLNKSIESINKSIASAKKKLNVTSLQELVARALYLGLIK